MTLREWRERNGLTQAQVAEQLRVTRGDGKQKPVSQNLISKWETRECTPRLPAIRDIEKFTNGAVTVDSWG